MKIIYTANAEAALPMRTEIGDKIRRLPESQKAEMKADLDKLTKIPSDLLRRIVERIAKTYPCCNTVELAALEAEESGYSEPEELNDAVAVWTYLWSNMEGQPIEGVKSDLIELRLLSDNVASILTDLLESAEPFREAAKTLSAHLRVGAPLFVSIRGVVDVRCLFHEKEADFTAGKLPETVVNTHPVIMANLFLNDPSDKDIAVSFMMDESDLSYLKRFVRNMEKELELSKSSIVDRR